MLSARHRWLLWSALQVWRHHRLQGLLSVAGVVAGVAGLVLVLAIGEGARREIDRALARLGAGTMLVRSPPSLPVAERIAFERSAALARLLGGRLQQQVPVIVRQEVLSVPGLRRDRVRVLGTTAGYAPAHQLALREGRFLAPYDVERRRPVCVLGAELGRAVLQAGGRLGGDVRVGDRPCTLVGLLAPAHRADETLAGLELPDFDRAVYVPLTTLADGSGGSPRLDELVLHFRAGEDLLRAGPVVPRIVEFGRELPLLEYVMPVETLRQKLRTQTVLGYLLAGTTLVMLAVGGIGIMNMMLVNVLRRRPEIGLRRAVGATRADIIAQFVTESVLVTLAGGLVGVVAGGLAAAALAAALGWTVAVPWWGVALALLVAVAMGAGFGGYPALKAASVEPIRTLNHG